jgi:non-canonical poly(A) RNA polymerase PAPD5/7
MKRKERDSEPASSPIDESTPRKDTPKAPSDLAKEINSFAAYLKPTSAEEGMRHEVIRRINLCVKDLWPQAKVEVFGSYVTTLILPTSDLDVAVCGVDDDQAEVLKRLAKVIQRKRIAESVNLVAKAKVPIIKMVDLFTKIKVDICVNGNGSRNSQFICAHVNTMPELRPLCLIVKQLLVENQSNDTYTGGMSSWLLCLILIHHIQMRRKSNDSTKLDLGEMLTDFLRLFGTDFDYEGTGISIRNGGYYFSKETRGWNDPNHPTLLAVEDPFEPDVNVGPRAHRISAIRQIFIEAYQKLTSKAFQGDPSRNRRSADKYPMLSSILNIDFGALVRRFYEPAKKTKHELPMIPFTPIHISPYHNSFSPIFHIPRPVPVAPIPHTRLFPSTTRDRARQFRRQ